MTGSMMTIALVFGVFLIAYTGLIAWIVLRSVTNGFEKYDYAFQTTQQLIANSKAGGSSQSHKGSNENHQQKHKHQHQQQNQHFHKNKQNGGNQQNNSSGSFVSSAAERLKAKREAMASQNPGQGNQQSKPDSALKTLG